MGNNELRISTDNHNNGIKLSVSASADTDVVKINNNDVEYYEKKAAKSAEQAKERLKDCEKYATEAKASVHDCQNIADDLQETFNLNLDAHIENTDNPHKVTAEQLEVYTKNECDSKYLTEHQDISGKADKSQIPTKVSDLINDSGYLNKIPSEYVTETELTSKGYLTSVPENYVTDTELSAKGYLTTIPDTYAKKVDIPDVSMKADKSQIPTKISELINDSGYITSHQDISGKVDKSDLAKVATSGSYNDLSDKPIIPEGASVDIVLSETSNNSVANSVVSKALKFKQDVISDINEIRENANLVTSKQDKISDLDTIRNGANLGTTALQNIPSEYVTESELASKGYLTSHQNISGKADKNDLIQKADLNLKNCTVPYVKEIYTKDGNGYVLYSNDLCKQWGRLKKGGAIGKSSAWKGTVTLPKSYNNTEYTIIVSCNYGADVASNAGSEVSSGEMASSSFAFCMYNRNGSSTAKNIEINWCTIGFISGGRTTNEGGGGGPVSDGEEIL